MHAERLRSGSLIRRVAAMIVTLEAGSLCPLRAQSMAQIGMAVHEVVERDRSIARPMQPLRTAHQ
jgi:hypothetical protein